MKERVLLPVREGTNKRLYKIREIE